MLHNIFLLSQNTCFGVFDGAQLSVGIMLQLSFASVVCNALPYCWTSYKNPHLSLGHKNMGELDPG